MRFLRTQPTLLALSILATLYTPAALATPLTATQLHSMAFSVSKVDPPQLAQDNNAFGTFAFTQASDSDGQTFGQTFANSGGAFAVSTDATGGLISFPAYSEAASTLDFILTNTTSIAQRYFLTMKIYGGSLSTDVYDPNGLSGQESLTTGYAAKVQRVTDRLNNTRVTMFESSATIERTANGIDLMHSGQVLSGADSEANAELSGYYGWDTDYYTIDLGVVAAGDFTQITANLAGFSRSTVGSYSFDGEDGYGYCGFIETDEPQSSAAPAREVSCFKGYARQFYGDPLSGQDQDVFSFDTRPANHVSAPGSLLLAGGALGAAGLVRRRRKASSTN